MLPPAHASSEKQNGQSAACTPPFPSAPSFRWNEEILHKFPGPAMCVHLQCSQNKHTIIHAINIEFQKLTGFSQAEIQDASPLPLFAISSNTESLLQLEQYLYDDNPAQHQEMLLYQKTGPGAWVELSFSEILEDEDKVYRLIFINNISHLKNKESRLSTALKESRSKHTALQQALNRETLLRTIQQCIQTGKTLESAGANIAKTLCNTLKVDMCILWRHSKNAQTSQEHECPTPLGYYNANASVQNNALTPNALLTPKLITSLEEQKKILILRDPSEYHDYTEQSDTSPIHAAIITGTYFENKINGIVALYQFHAKRFWQTHEVTMIKDVAKEIADAIEYTRVLQELTKALEKEKHLNELQSEFVSVTSHEFRTPLAIIDSSAQLLQKSSSPLTPEYINKQTNKIRRSIDRMVGLIESTLSLSKLETGKIEYHPTDTNLRELTQDITTRKTELCPDKQFSLDIEQLPTHFQGDKMLLEQILTNLLSNAAKYSPPNATIHISGTTTDEYTEIAIYDHGMGIPEEDIPRLFSKFFRASNTTSTAGTGIGLYVTKSLVELHHGTIHVDSTLNKGSTFTVRFPLHPQAFSTSNKD